MFSRAYSLHIHKWTIHTRKSGTAKLVELMDLVDSLINKFGKEDEPPTHRRGSHRIDFLFCTPSIKKSYFVLASYQSMKFFLRIIGDINVHLQEFLNDLDHIPSQIIGSYLPNPQTLH